MASSSSPTRPVPGAQGQAATQQRLTETWVRLVKQLTSSKDYQDIAGLVAKTDVLALRNEKLERELQDALIAETRNFDAIQKVKNENTAMKDACLQKASEVKMATTKESQAQSQLEKAQKEVADLKQELGANASKISETLKSKLEKETQIRTLTDKLEKMAESFRQTEADLKKTHQLNMGQLKKVLDTTTEELTNLKALAMPLKVQTDKRIPSKQLSTIFDDAYQLVTHFFSQLELSDYVFSTVSWDRLTELECLEGIPLPPTNSAAANRMRVAADEYGKKRATAASKDVYDSVSFMLDDRKAFGRALLAWFDKVCNTWRSLQQFENQGQAAVNGAAPDGTDMKPNPNAKLELANIAAQVWPAFLVMTTAGKLEPLKAGYVLLKAQTAAADHELSSHAIPEMNLDIRRMGRGQRLGIIPTNGANNTRERLDTFLY
ncbi:hypothetical protein INS49_007915 [Diaporthe citri]|uniref:uncharacterized protein n=1 Tax=Diaporthe citri TaxID=83186 RepID=UPI001C7E4A16|nr:uncharacterized protein INS49_007915 [Diaporthe citri]KAG6362821.1 hypothetical protein INS49_007915 [Diaporthe citri]